MTDLEHNALQNKEEINILASGKKGKNATHSFARRVKLIQTQLHSRSEVSFTPTAKLASYYIEAKCQKKALRASFAGKLKRNLCLKKFKKLKVFNQLRILQSKKTYGLASLGSLKKKSFGF